MDRSCFLWCMNVLFYLCKISGKFSYDITEFPVNSTLESPKNKFPSSVISYDIFARALDKTNVSFVTEADAVDGAEGLVPGW